MASIGDRIARARRGSMLLEVLLSLGILTLGMATIGLQVNSGLRQELLAAEVFRQSSLVESMVSQVEAMVARHLSESQTEGTAGERSRDVEIEGEFGLVFPGYGYRILVEPTQVERLNRVTIELLKAPFDLRSGELLEEPERVYLTRMLRASPPQINLDRLGVTLDPEQRNLLEMGGLLDDSGNLDIQRLLAMDPGALMELLPLLMSAFGGGQMAEMMGNMSPEQLLEMLQEQQRGNSGEAGQESGTSAGDEPSDGQSGAQAGDENGDSAGDLFDETAPGGGLTQEQYEWMLEQLRKKGGG